MPKFTIKDLDKLISDKIQPPAPIPIDRRGTLRKLLNVAKSKKAGLWQQGL